MSWPGFIVLFIMLLVGGGFILCIVEFLGNEVSNKLVITITIVKVCFTIKFIVMVNRLIVILLKWYKRQTLYRINGENFMQ